MGIVMDSKTFCNKLENIARNVNTVYATGMIGNPITDKAISAKVAQYPRSYSASKVALLRSMVGKNYFGFDCVCLIKSVLWGFNANPSASYGGAAYQSNGVPDIGEDSMIAKCAGVTTDFSNIVIGEAVWIPGHIGIYIGNGRVVECTTKWEGKVQISVLGNNPQGASGNTRSWNKHGRLPWIDYSTSIVQPTPAAQPVVQPVTQTYSLSDFTYDVQGAIGVAQDRHTGPITLGALPTISARKNKNHPVVKFVQKRLYTLGFTEVGPADGDLGPKFTLAANNFQKSYGGVGKDGEFTHGGMAWRKILGVK